MILVEKGHSREDLVFIVEKSSIPPNINLELGKRLRVTLQNGRETIVSIQYIGERFLVFDKNDPLVGEKRNSRIELIEIL